ncbi:hypothetical protein BSL82_15590 [Tardibacter chloracetimidivorans]|uniref:Large polyvalent protein associated domain-containing protein n=1 Tax=Tardibacter chloracetimidivorans TaxID=1921510 RepID=A0A1L3ZY23_9SPHN|nr:LPD1 domain-containing protein [Tardibacter chloracetimidivorans]API60527.1 hypothetical protein BSL82_15590 [Tardibacter chloracetimidivorans]
MGFDVAAAKQAGYSDAEIADFLAKDQKFDTSGARKAGYSDGEIISHLSSVPSPKPAGKPAAPSSYETQRRQVMDRQAKLTADPQGGEEAAGALVRGGARSALPTTAGVMAFTPGFTAGATLGALAGPAAPVVSPLAGLVGGLATSMGAGYGAGVLQEKALDLAPESVVRALGQTDEQRTQDVTAHPHATMIGEMLPGFLFGRPSLSPTRVAPNAGPLERVLANPVMASTAGATIGGGQEAARELVTGEGLDPAKIAIAAGAGALQNRNTRLGDATMAVGDKIVRATVRPVTKGVDAGVDLLARRAAARQPDVPDASAVADLVPAEAVVARPMAPEPVVEPVPTAPDQPMGAAVEPRPVEGVSPPAAADGPGARNDPLRPDPGPLGEGERYVTTPAGNRVRTRFEVVDSRALKAAEGDLQNRDRSRASTDIQVQDIVSKFDPTRLGDSAETDRGAPIIGPDDVVESGNGRMLALNRVFDEFPDRAQAYRDYLESQGHRTEGIERPVLVRRRVSDFTPEQRVQFVRDSNFDTKLQMGSAERAKTDAAGINGETLDLYRGGDVTDAANRDFVRVVVGKLPPQEQAAFFTADGQISADGVRRIRAALKAAAYDDADLLGTLDESQDNNIKSIGGALESNAAGWARLRTDIADGKVLPQFDITKALTAAAKAIRDLRQKGESVRDFLAQVDAFMPRDPVTDGLIRLFYNEKLTAPASKQAITAAIGEYVKRARAQLSDPGMFGNDGPDNPADLIDDILAGRSGDRDQTSFLAAAEDRMDLDLADAPDMAGSKVKTEAEGKAPDRGAYQPSFAEASFTNRQSVNDSAARAMGMDPEKFNLLPPARKAKLLGDALEKLTGVKVAVAPDMPLQYAIDQMLDAHQTLQGMASVLGISPKAISLGGNLSLRLLKGAKFLGAFNPGANQIMLPKRSNSFAHEWAHALDYYLLGKVSPDMARGLTGKVRADGADFQPANVREAFVKLLNAMFFDEAEMALKIMDLEKRIAETKSANQKAALQTQIDNFKTGRSKSRTAQSAFYRGAAEVNRRGGQGDYWTQPTEMFARSFEAFTAFKMASEGFGSEFVTKGNENYLSDAEDRFRLTFPKGDERARIFDAMQGVMDMLNAENMIREANGGEVTPRIAADFDSAAESGPNPADVKRTMAIVERRNRSMADRLFGADREALTIWRHNRDAAKADAELRAADPVKIGSKINNVRSLAFSAAADGVKMIATRWGSKAAQKIADQFMSDLGGTRHVSRTWHQSIEMRTNKALNPVMAQLQKHGSKGWVYKSLSKEQTSTLRDLLLGKKVDDDMGLTPLADAMRKAYNDEWYENRNAGVDLGYVNDAAYIHRQIDREYVAKNPDKFTEQAQEVYGLVFDRDVGADAGAIAGDPDRLENFIAIARQNGIDGVKALRKAMRDDDGDPEAVSSLIDEMLDEVRSAYAMQAAFAYRDAILHTETFPDYTMTSSLPNAEKRRSLPPEADDILKDFYNPDPVSSLIQYVRHSVQRTEWAKRFGHPDGKNPAGSIARQLDEQMAQEGVPESERRYVWSLVDRMTGRYRRTGWLANPGVVSALSFLRVKGTLAMMGRAVTLSTFEPAAMGIVTGSPIDGAKAVAKTWASILHSGTRQELRDWGMAHGFIKHHLLEQFMMQDRFGTTSDSPTRWDQLSGWMFRNSGITFLTNMSDVAVMDVARRGLVNEMSHRVLDGDKRGKEAANLMRELGVRDPDAFARQIVDMQGALPSEEWLAGPEGYDYNTALLRLANMTIQKANAADLTPLSRNPLASYATYSITSYIQSAYRHLLKRNITKGARLAKEGEIGLLAQYTAGTLLSAGLLYGFNMLASITREVLFNPERQEEWEKDGQWWKANMALAASRTFSFGAFDPMINSWTGLKYNRDLAYLPLGAYMGADFQNMTNMAKTLTDRNSPNTNTAEYNALRSFYGFALAPAMAGVVAAFPGGPIYTTAAGAGTAYGTSPKAGDIFATAVVGEKDGRKRKKKTEKGASGR